MPLNPYAKIIVSVAGGAGQSGGVTALNGQTLQLTGESTVGWSLCRWELFDYPSGFSLPAGWSADSAGVYYSTAITPPAITWPASTTVWGKLMMRLRINDALTNASAASKYTDESTAVRVLSPNGLRGIGAGETNQFSATWIDEHQADLRTIEAFTGGGGGSTTLTAVADLAALRAVASPTDGQTFSVASPPGVWVCSTSAGAGIADDGYTVVKKTASTGSAVIYYNTSTSPVLPTIAALRLAVTGKQPSISVTAFSTLGDGGGGTFIYDSTDVTSADNGGTIIVAGTRRYKRRFSGALHAEWFGVKADGIQLTDVDLTANYLGSGHARAVSASALFTPSMVGRPALGRTPSNPLTGTADLVDGNVISNCAGTTLLTDIPNSSGFPSGGGLVYVFNTAEYVPIYSLTDNTHIRWRSPPSITNAGCTLYTETQLETTVSSYVSSTEIRFTAPAVISRTLGKWFIATDDTLAVKAAIDAAFALGISEIQFPAGLIGMSQNLLWTGKRNLRVKGQGKRRTLFADLRKASTNLSYVGVNNYAVLTFESCSGIVLDSIGFDGNLPAVGLHNSPTYMRKGFMFRGCSDSVMVNVTDGVSGARDEHLYSDGDCPNLHYDRCEVLHANSNAINPGHGPTEAAGLRVTYCVANSACGNAILASAKSAYIDGNTVSIDGLRWGAQTWGTGSDVCAFGTFGDMQVVNNILRNSDMTGGGSSGMIFFGSPGSAGNLRVAGNIFAGIKNVWHSPAAACIKLDEWSGQAVIEGNTIDDCPSVLPGARMVLITGATTKNVVIGANYFGAKAGSNNNVGYEVDATVPAGAVHFKPGSTFGPAITSRRVLPVAVKRTNDLGETRDGATLRDQNQVLMVGEYAATFTASGATLTAAAHTLLVGDTITATTTGTLPAGLVTTSKYYVVSAPAGTFQVSATPGGTAITTATGGTGTHTFRRAGGHLWTLPQGTMTANRTDTLSTAGSPAPTLNEAVEIERLDATAFTCAIVNGGPGAGTLYTFPVSDTRSAKFKFDGTNWAFVEHQGINP